MKLEETIGDLALRQTTLRLMRREQLSQGEAGEFLEALLSPNATDAQIAAALTALALKGETVEEIVGMAEAMRDRAVRLHSRHARFIDTAGTGSSPVKTFNVSTAAAFVIAGAGLPVAKHGSRAATSRCGSADLLEALGVNTGASPEIVEQCLNEHEICFVFAPLFHGATARVAQVRRKLGIRTAFNLLGPLTNPARAPFQILGVWDQALAEQIASALALLGTERAWVVHGSDGLDEITLTGDTYVTACSANSETASGLQKFTISPLDFGLPCRSLAEFRGGDAMENAKLTRAILHNEKAGSVAAARDLVIANAAAALHLAGVAPDLRQGAILARDSIASGSASAKLEALIRETNR
jgi:anthranilate phosphoribosyltransferase